MASEDKTESITENKTESVIEKQIESGKLTITETKSEKKTEIVPEKPGKSELPKEKTELLDPLTAVRLVWAITDGFPKSRLLKKKEEADLKEPDPQTSKNVYANVNAYEANNLLSTIVTASENHTQEKEYISRAVIAMRAALRNLGTIYSGRELNFKENDALRDAYIASITASITLGNDFKEYTKGLPAALGGSLAGLGVSYFAKEFLGLSLTGADYLWFVFLFGIAGYAVAWIIMKYGYNKQFRGLIQQELERNIYYEQYLYRAHLQLQALFKELNTIHQEVFKTQYPEATGKEAIENLIKSLCPTACENVSDCARRGGTNPDTWVWCETSVGRSCLSRQEKTPKPEECPNWKPEGAMKRYIIPAAIIAVVVITGIFIFVSASPGPGVTLEKNPSSQNLTVNQSLFISVKFSNQAEEAINDLIIKDTVPDGFNLTNGNTTSTRESLEKGGPPVFMNYTLTAMKEGEYTLPPAKASFSLNGSLEKISSNSVQVKVSTAGGASPAQGATNPTKNTTPT